jgi:hypothetical protein
MIASKLTELRYCRLTAISTSRSRHHDDNIFSFTLLLGFPRGGQRLRRGDSKDRRVHLAVGATSPTWCRGEQQLGGLSVAPVTGAVASGAAGSSGPVASPRRRLLRDLPTCRRGLPTLPPPPPPSFPCFPTCCGPPDLYGFTSGHQ